MMGVRTDLSEEHSLERSKVLCFGHVKIRKPYKDTEVAMSDWQLENLT